jgi:hypothetical protein
MTPDEARAAAKMFWGAQPSPHAAELTNAEFPVAVKLATKLKFGGHASPSEASSFWGEFKAFNNKLRSKNKLELTPEEFGHVVDSMAPVSFAFHGRPPQMHEIEKLHDQSPQSVHNHYYHLPDRDHPTVPAGEMVKSIEAARPHAREYLERDPVKLEAAYLYHSGQSPADYYRVLGSQKDVQAQAPGDSGRRGMAYAGGSKADQRDQGDQRDRVSE